MKEKIRVIFDDSYKTIFRVVAETSRSNNGKSGIAKIDGDERILYFDFWANPANGDYRGWVCNLTSEYLVREGEEL